MCIDIFSDIESSKVTTNYSTTNKGIIRKRPFNYNKIINLFESRT